MTTDKVLLEQMCAIAYEGITGKCWHMDKKGHRFAAFHCGKCNTDNTEADNPDLLNSLDAWHKHIFSVMSIKQKNNHDWELTKMKKWQWSWETPPLHHLEACLKMLGKWKPEWEG